MTTKIAESAERGLPVKGEGISWMDRMAVVYLALPVFIFFAGWFRPLYAVFLCAVLFCGVLPVMLKRDGISIRKDLAASFLLCAGIGAILWTIFGGAGHFLYANLDWPVRDAVLRDLVVYDWPVKYGTLQGNDIILRCPLAFYLPAALAAKVLGLQYADALLFAWTAVGVFIFFALALDRAETVKQAVLVMLVVVLFSGADALGMLVVGVGVPAPPQHLEWWATFFQYSSNTTQLFWVPNHALSAWLIAALLFKHRLTPVFMRLAPISIATTALWSPLVTIGLMPFVGYAFWKLFRDRALWRALSLPSVLSGLLVFAVLAAYVTMDGKKIHSGWTFAWLEPYPFLWGKAALNYVVFVLVEFAVLIIALHKMARGYLLGIIAPWLILLPLYSLGPSNDLAMRASIPALMLICLSCAYAVSQMKWSRERIPGAEVVLVLMLAFGAVTPVYEFWRALALPSWKPEQNKNLVEAAKGMPPHYVGALKTPLMKIMMKPPSEGSSR